MKFRSLTLVILKWFSLINITYDNMLFSSGFSEKVDFLIVLLFHVNLYNVA